VLLRGVRGLFWVAISNAVGRYGCQQRHYNPTRLSTTSIIHFNTFYLQLAFFAVEKFKGTTVLCQNDRDTAKLSS